MTQSFEEHVKENMETLRQVVEHQQYVLTAITSTLREMQQGTEQEQPRKVEEGETRGTTTAYRLPDGRGTLLVNIKPGSNTATISIKTHPHMATTHLEIKGEKARVQ